MSVQRQRGPTSINGVAYALVLLTLIAVVALALAVGAVHVWQDVFATPHVSRILLGLVLTAGACLLGIPVVFLLWMIGGIAINLVRGKPEPGGESATVRPDPGSSVRETRADA